MEKTMKTFVQQIAVVLIPGILLMSGCSKDDDIVPTPTLNQNFTQLNLVASTNTFAGARVDPNLINAWGIAFGATGTAWLSSQGKGVSTVYDKAGVERLPAVSIPSASGTTGGSPTGQVFNSSSDFVLSNGSPARFIFSGTDGIISGWSTGAAALKAKDRSATSAYTGLAIGANAGSNYLYAADFRSGKIDVFDKNFALVTMSFTDPSIPGDYRPFNIQNIGGQLYVLYAKQDEVTHKEARGAGLGYVSIFNTDGSFVKRFTSQGMLNAPWGVAMAPAGYVTKTTGNAILIGNFGDGRINAFDTDGNLLGALQAGGADIVIDGLWGISFAPATATTVDPNWLFFAAGPANETQGLYGYITK